MRMSGIDEEDAEEERDRQQDAGREEQAAEIFDLRQPLCDIERIGDLLQHVMRVKDQQARREHQSDEDKERRFGLVKAHSVPAEGSSALIA
jgi:hypothetical protein